MKAPTADAGAATPIPKLMPLAQSLNETTHMTDAKAFIGWLDTQAFGGEEPEDRHAGLLHGRTDGVSHGGGGAGSSRSGRVVPRRRPRHQMPNSPHLQAATSKAQFLVAIAASDDDKAPNDKTAEGDVRQGEPARRSRGVYWDGARLVPPGFKVYSEPQAERPGAVCSCFTGKRWRSASAQRFACFRRCKTARTPT